jgi:hypothetical protein
MGETELNFERRNAPGARLGIVARRFFARRRQTERSGIAVSQVLQLRGSADVARLCVLHRGQKRGAFWYAPDTAS